MCTYVNFTRAVASGGRRGWARGAGAPWTCWARHIKSVDGVVFFRLRYFDNSDLQLFAIFRFEVDFSETYFMTSAKNSVSEPQNLKIVWEGHPETRGNPPYRGLLGYIDREVSLRTRKGEKKVGTVNVTPLSLPIKTREWYLQRRSHSTSTAWKIWPDTLFIRDFGLLEVWFLCTVKVVLCEQKTLTRKLQPVEKSCSALWT